MAKQQRTAGKTKDSDNSSSAAAGGSSTMADLREMIELMGRHDLEEVEVESGGMKVRLKRRSAHAPAAAQPWVAPLPPQAPVARSDPMHLGPAVRSEVKDVTPAGEAEKTVEIRSPMVGTFYAAPSPDSPPFAAVGKEVGPETVVCIIEAMKVMNEINAEVSGTIVKVLVQNGQAVEFNQPLFQVRPR